MFALYSVYIFVLDLKYVKEDPVKSKLMQKTWKKRHGLQEFQDKGDLINKDFGAEEYIVILGIRLTVVSILCKSSQLNVSKTHTSLSTCALQYYVHHLYSFD